MTTTPMVVVGDCARCGRAVAYDWWGRLSHLRKASPNMDVTCRAASYDPNRGWDLSLPAQWTASLSARGGASRKGRGLTEEYGWYR